jgi:hypothetical protein
MRGRLGLDSKDTRKDVEIEHMTPMQRVRLIAGWTLGSDCWADTFKEYFESQGIYLTIDPNAEGILR